MGNSNPKPTPPQEYVMMYNVANPKGIKKPKVDYKLKSKRDAIIELVKVQFFSSKYDSLVSSQARLNLLKTFEDIGRLTLQNYFASLIQNTERKETFFQILHFVRRFCEDNHYYVSLLIDEESHGLTVNMEDDLIVLAFFTCWSTTCDKEHKISFQLAVSSTTEPNVDKVSFIMRLLKITHAADCLSDQYLVYVLPDMVLDIEKTKKLLLLQEIVQKLY